MSKAAPLITPMSAYPIRALSVKENEGKRD